MTTAIFVVGIIVFLITVLGTIAVGGLSLTGSQLAGDPDLAPRVPGSKRKGHLAGASHRQRRVLTVDPF
jgi:hypothetical protein